MKKPKNITIIGRRWFQKTYGNTYYSAEIYIDGKMVHKIPRAYGYENQYEYDAFEWLYTHGYTIPIDCQKIISVSDVARRKDL